MADFSTSQHAADSPQPPRDAATRPRMVCLEELLLGNTELLIKHGEETYRLRLTRNGRLLLTK